MHNNLEINTVIDRCVSCRNKPCQIACPLNNDNPEIIKLVKEKKYEEAYNLLTKTNVLPAICGRICPHEKQCQGKCTMRFKKGAVEIGTIESFLGDMAIKENFKIEKYGRKKKKRVAVIGSGPASLTCAAFLARNGYNTTIYEKHSYLGGLLYHGIPEFRLPKEILKKSIDKILDLGIEVKLNKELGKDFTLSDLDNYDAVFLGIGANISSKMNIPGEDLNGVFGGNELLENAAHQTYKNKKVAVIGGGNVAIDVARTINKQNPHSVTVIYRRNKDCMPAEVKEVDQAILEGINFEFNTNLVKIIGSDKVKKIECIKTKLKEVDGKQKPVNIKDSNFLLNMDYVVMAVGSISEKEVLEKLSLDVTKNNYILVNEFNQTSNKKVFASGDLTNTISTVAYASRGGRDAAECIMEFLSRKVNK